MTWENFLKILSPEQISSLSKAQLSAFQNVQEIPQFSTPVAVATQVSSQTLKSSTENRSIDVILEDMEEKFASNNFWEPIAKQCDVQYLILLQ